MISNDEFDDLCSSFSAATSEVASIGAAAAVLLTILFSAG
jgi:hypothetical protein